MTVVHLRHLIVLKKNSELRQITLHIRKTEITVEGKNSADLIKTLKTIYNQQKGTRLYYEVLMPVSYTHLTLPTMAVV